MIDPINITDFNASTEKLEEMILFWVCAAGKNGVTAAKCLDNLLYHLRQQTSFLLFPQATPFQVLRAYLRYSNTLPSLMKACGIGCFNQKAKTFTELVNSGLDLRVCTVDDLEQITGIGPKTARCFLIHSRPNQRLTGLDVHVLHYLRDQGFDVPKVTPSGRRYREIEQIFLGLVPEGKSVSEFDLEIWNTYRKN